MGVIKSFRCLKRISQLVEVLETPKQTNRNTKKILKGIILNRKGFIDIDESEMRELVKVLHTLDTYGSSRYSFKATAKVVEDKTKISSERVVFLTEKYLFKN